jgi:membrane protease YdiL (CAAX protease family)
LTTGEQLHTLHIVPTTNEVSPFAGVEDPSAIDTVDVQSKQQSQVTDPNNPVWGVGGALLFWVASMLLQAIIPLLFLIPYALHRGLDPGSPDFTKGVLELAVADPTAVFLQVLSILPTHILTLAFLWLFVTRFGRRPFLASFGWEWSRRYGLREGAALVGLGVALFIVGAVLAKLLGGDNPTQLEQLINSSTKSRYTIAALAVLTAPFVEEFVYRGVVYSAMQRFIGVKGAVVFVLALFTLIHVPQYWPNIGVISAVALLSFVLTVVRAYSGRLLPCVIIHMAFNAVQAVILIFEPYVHQVLPTTPPPVPPASMFVPLIRFIF